jgi:hypothetical protein
MVTILSKGGGVPPQGPIKSHGVSAWVIKSALISFRNIPVCNSNLFRIGIKGG